MSFPLNRASLATALVALAGAVIPKDPGGQAVRFPPPRPEAPTRTRVFRTWRSSAPQIKQGFRECARRQGGQVWAEFKAADRVRRGIYDAQELDSRHRHWLKSKDWIRREVMGDQA